MPKTTDLIFIFCPLWGSPWTYHWIESFHHLCRCWKWILGVSTPTARSRRRSFWSKHCLSKRYEISRDHERWPKNFMWLWRQSFTVKLAWSCRGLPILTGLSEVLQRENYNSHRRTLWRNTLIKSLGTNYLTCFPASTRRNFPLRVTSSASKLAWSHGFTNSLVTCSRRRRLWRSWYDIYSIGESEILWVERYLMIFVLPYD